MVLVLSASQPRFALFICPWLKQQFLSAAMQPSDGSARRPANRFTYSRTVQPAHGFPRPQGTMISSLNIESARNPICEQPRPTSLELLEYRCNGSRTNLKEQFYQSLELLDRREASRKHHQQRQTHCQEPHDDGASTQTPELSDKQNKFKEVGDEEEARKLSEGEEISSCESVSTSTRKTPLSSGAEQDQEAQRSEPRQPEYKERDEATRAAAHNPVADPAHIRTGSEAMKTFGSTPMQRGVFRRTSFGNLGEGEWFVHRILQLAGTPTHNCLNCVNRLAWTCKQIHIWFYSTFETDPHLVLPA